MNTYIRIGKSILLIGAAMVLSLLIAITATAGCRAEKESREFRKQQEKNMVQDVRNYLTDQGYRNSGVMLTKTTMEDGSMVYKLTVHHGKIDKLSEEQKGALLKELSVFDIELEGCSFVREFL